MIRFSQSMIPALLIFLAACGGKKPSTFIVTNATPHRIDSLRIAASWQDGDIVQLQPGETRTYILSMEGQTQDGNYRIRYRTPDSSYQKFFGYFTNGYPVEKHTFIRLEGDSMRIKPVYEKY